MTLSVSFHCNIIEYKVLPLDEETHGLIHMVEWLRCQGVIRSNLGSIAFNVFWNVATLESRFDLWNIDWQVYAERDITSINYMKILYERSLERGKVGDVFPNEEVNCHGSLLQYVIAPRHSYGGQYLCGISQEVMHHFGYLMYVLNLDKQDIDVECGLVYACYLAKSKNFKIKIKIWCS